jgi:mono/diheme cytochrome c family protein
MRDNSSRFQVSARIKQSCVNCAKASFAIGVAIVLVGLMAMTVSAVAQSSDKSSASSVQSGQSSDQKQAPQSNPGQTAGAGQTPPPSEAPPGGDQSAEQNPEDQGGIPINQAVSHVGNLNGNAIAGKEHYRRFCVGCHGTRGDGEGENAQWIDPKPRDFVAGTFKCRSTPTGSLPTDQDLYNSVKRGFVTTNMPSWDPLLNQDRADLVAYIKTFSYKWRTQKPSPPIQIPPETPVTLDSIKRGHDTYQKMECWKCHGQQGHGDGPSANTLTDSKDRPIRPYDFTEGDRFKCGDTNNDIYRDFMTGLDGTPMPSFADQLKPNEAWDLVHYLRTLQTHYHGPEQELIKSHGKPQSSKALRGQKTGGQ